MPVVTNRIPTTPDIVLSAIEAQLQSAFSAAQVFISLNDDAEPQYPPSTVFVVITPGDARSTGEDAGGGRDNSVYEWSLEITAMASVSTDPGNKDDAFLTDPNIGIIQATNAIANYLQNFDPVDDDGNGLLTRPARIENWKKPSRPAGKFGRYGCDLEVRFVWSMDATEPGS